MIRLCENMTPFYIGFDIFGFLSVVYQKICHIIETFFKKLLNITNIESIACCLYVKLARCGKITSNIFKLNIKKQDCTFHIIGFCKE